MTPGLINPNPKVHDRKPRQESSRPLVTAEDQREEIDAAEVFDILLAAPQLALRL